MNRFHIRRHEMTLLPDSARVIVRPFIPTDRRRVTAIVGRAMALTEEEVVREWNAVQRSFEGRHRDLESILLDHCHRVHKHVVAEAPLSRERQLLIGALFSGEYALESAALFNPSMVPHPDQGGTPAGGLRFIMSLRATGEGHISSIEFRTGIITPDRGVALDAVSRFVTAAEVVPDPSYEKERFISTLQDMGCYDDHARAILAPLGEIFTRTALNDSLKRDRHQAPRDARGTGKHILWLAESNYELRFEKASALSERAIFPVSSNESNGIEDARFVRFVDDDGTVMYYATYTAYDGRAILPQLIETKDFLHFRIRTLDGSAVKNKGMAIFPRRIAGRYAMLSRQDDENLFIMFSDTLYAWNDPRVLMQPAQSWESVKVGNCGSPLETEAGWLVITHGVGPMRTYCIGALLLDLEDPSNVVGRLRDPLIAPEEDGREGYVPNVVYSCGALIHGRELILPYAMSDRASVIARISLDDLLAVLRESSA